MILRVLVYTVRSAVERRIEPISGVGVVRVATFREICLSQIWSDSISRIQLLNIRQPIQKSQNLTKMKRPSLKSPKLQYKSRNLLE